MIEIKRVKNKRKCHTCGVDVKQDGAIAEYGGMYHKNICIKCLKDIVTAMEVMQNAKSI